MLNRRLRQLVRQFHENGMKLLLENPQNVRDLLHLIQAEGLHLIDWDQLTLDRTTYVERDFRHVEADVVLRAPRLGQGREQSQEHLLIYILIEHQSKPDVLMVLRVLDYVVQIYKAQARAWQRRHGSTDHLRLSPVLPVVFYTGSRSWDHLAGLEELLHENWRRTFQARVPALAPLFVNLGEIPVARLESAGGFFGWVLELVRRRKARPAEFQVLLDRVVRHLETMPRRERLRWLELLSYIHALVYHARRGVERKGLLEKITVSVETDDHRQEVVAMHQTIAQAVEAEGRKKEAIQRTRRILVRLLRKRFGELPPGLEKTIKRTKEIKKLDAWLERFATAATLEDVAIDGGEE